MENESNTSPITYSDELVSDLHKDARGYRPTESFWSYWNLLMPSEKQGVWDGLCAHLIRMGRCYLFKQKETA